ncbi:oxygen-independent coproporphyrinogen III oxidase [Helicobacter saguini]|uniref:Coproporphyrinogen-III oxidase n=1 Tax=Helicobacter saguini TaxID=1548018 RepID=A0A347VNP2_9HELI|nr:oxygen-independent coproporphyrinogen III oxidase [Helicobacter saguini]MWV61690.1 oxygen-independent coproporphyrinogen III oxidase [Helicobacter saguini]MWV67638.1 oxygen-independent coproporphyrinogen III oxidase [Helicobacter saguini]MWV69989.1 oxygen-independent coproporphyrinogen III oxidase [Helicobacter saguini]MWV72797.1 oxygen-independent coproporphyrinogen III oxidase [Helicobacter saguini]TLD91987.1 oxygen-independent coproporphyrinogen III oxidase [Helicobacter saguini]
MSKQINFSKLATHSKPGPRYTSYPTANEFNKNFNAKSLQNALKRADESYPDTPLSLYTHLPFCKSACYFCGCNVIYTNSESKKVRYIEYLQKELDLLENAMDTSRKVVQFHFGGGTPTFFSATQLDSIIKKIKKTFPNFTADCEVSCEIDPRYFNEEQMAILRENGFNRVSFGVQDFDSIVQENINRIQSVELVESCVKIARKYGVDSINFDLIYGLPAQNLVTFSNTLSKVLSLNPDRLAIFNYAHVPWVKSSMQKINESLLPNPTQKLEILEQTIKILTNNGYEMIGMDHFAKPGDELTKAQKKGELRRNFQGYTTKGFSQTIGLGLTSIGEGRDYYTQNFKDIASYENALNSGILPVNVGINLSSEDILRKEVIMSLMNNAFLDFDRISREFSIDFKSYFANELEKLKVMQDLELLELQDSSLKVTPTGTMLIRNIAMIFDTYLQKNSIQKFSKTI